MTDTPPPMKGWNYIPDVPLGVSPFFNWPPQPMSMLRWFWNSWFLISERLILIGIAFISFYWFQPPLEQSKTLAFDWIGAMYLRNLILMTLVAGGLHLYFYTFRKQGSTLKYDARDLAKKARVFTLNNQVRDNMIWTLISGVGIWTAYEVLMFWAFANGYLSMISWAQNPIWFIAIFLLIPVWESFYFYWIHRFLHWPPLYRLVHSLHHRNVNVGPWSGMSMHPIEHVMYLGSVLIHWAIASHPIHVLYHLQYFCLTAATTHTGFEGIVMRDKNRLALGTFHHQMHHRYFECNYGGLEMPWDKWFGSFHDGTPQANERMKERRKRIMGS